MTRKQIRDLTRKRLGETTSAFWSDVELNDWINDGGRDVCYRTKCKRTDGYLTTSSGVGEYSLSTYFPALLSIFRIYFYQNGSSWQKLDPTTEEELDILHPGWKSASSGVPTEYFYDLKLNRLGFYLKPNSSNAGTNYARVYYAEDFTNITDDNTEPNIPEFLHVAISDHVVAYGFEQRGYGDKANDAWLKYFSRLREWRTESDREREDEEIIMKNYKNIY
jgi:hypothetical protein